MNPRKKRKVEEQKKIPAKSMEEVYEKLIEAGNICKDHNLNPILKAHKSIKHPILHVLPSQTDIFKINPEKKKKPI